MKNKYFQMRIIIFLFFLGSIPLFIFSGGSVKSLIVLCSIGLLTGLLIILIKAFAIPPKWLFNNRFGLDGFVVVFLISLLPSFQTEKAFRFDSLVVGIIIGIVFGFFFIGGFQKRGFKNLSKKITFDINPDLEILSDIAVFGEKGKYISGKLILTKQKLLYVPIDSNMPMHEIDLHDKKNTVKIKSRFGIPNGIIINDNLKFSVSYSRLWIKKINAT